MNEYEHHKEQESTAVEQWEDIQRIDRPKWPVVIGVISIVWGGLWVLCGGLGLAMLPMSHKFVEGMLEGDPTPYGMVPTVTDYAIAGLGLVSSVILLFAGIMAVSRRPITRPMHLIHGIITIPLSIWSYLNQMAKAQLNSDWANDYPGNVMAPGLDLDSGQAAAGQILGLVFVILLGVIIPLFYLIWFGLIKTKPEQITGSDEGVY